MTGHTGHAVVMGPILLKPHSRGSVTLKSADPLAKPIVDPRYLTDAEGADRAALMAGLRITARIAETPTMRGLLRGIARPAGATRTRRCDSRAGARDGVAHAVSPGGHVPHGQ